MRLVKDLDGTGRTPNTTQRLIIDFVEDAWPNASVLGICAPVGCGKSFIARAIQRSVPGTVIIAPDNTLVRQYAATYPALTVCIGRRHYQQDVDADIAVGRYREGAAAIFNPASYWFRALRTQAKQPKCIILDEADAVFGMLQSFGTREMVVQAKDVTRPLLDILRDKQARAETQYCKRDCSEKAQKRREAAHRTATYWYNEVRQNEHLYTHRFKTEIKKRRVYKVVIEPLTIPRHVQQRFFGDAKVILLSATLAPHDAATLTGRDRGAVFKSFPSPIPVAQRPIFAGNLLPQAPAYGVDISSDVQSWITRLRQLGNGLVHATYADARAWSALWPDMMFHTTSNKAVMLSRFKKTGGVLIGSGMAAGIDLPGDLCRWNLIPRLQFPNLGDPAVQRRKALADGDRWYTFEALRHVMQATGRSTRNPGDWSVTVILDPRFSRLFTKHAADLPLWFREAVNLRQESFNELINRSKYDSAV